MRKKIFFTVLLIATLAFSQENNTPNMKELETFFYNKGYNDAKNKFYEKGYRDGLMFAEAKIKEYRAKIKALEQGKYLLKNKKITYPEVYQFTDKNGNIKVVVGGCKIEKPLTPQEIVTLPIIDKKVCQTVYGDIYSSIHYVDDETMKDKTAKTPNVTNSIFLPNDNKSSIVPNKPSDEKEIVYVFFPNTNFYKRLLDKSNILYTVYEDKIKALFNSKVEQRRFCRTYKLKINKDCL